MTATIPQPAARRRMVLYGGLWTAAAQLLPTAGVAVLSVVAARTLGADALGRQSLIAYVNSALGAVVVTGLGSASLRLQGALQGSGDLVLRDRLGAWTVRAHLVAGLAVFAALLGIGIAVGRDLLAWVLVGGVTVVDSVVGGVAVAVAVRQGWSRIGRLQLWAQLAGPPLGIAAVVAGLGIPGIFGADGIAAVVLLVVVVRRFHGVVAAPTRWRSPVPIARQWLLFSLGDLVYQVVSRRAEFVVLAIVSTDRQIATYSIAFMVVSLVAQLPSSVAVAAVPVVAEAAARGEQEESARHLRLAVRVGTLLSLPLAGLVAACGPPAILLVYGRQYDDAARLVPLGSLVLLVAVAGGVCGQFWSARGRMATTLRFGVAAGAVDVGVAFALAPSIGATGAVAANIVGQLVSAGALLVWTSRELGGIGWDRRSLVGAAAATVLGAGAGTAADWLVAWAVGDSAIDALARLAAATVAGVGVFVATARAVRVLSPAEVDWLAPLVPTRLARVLRAVAL